MFKGFIGSLNDDEIRYHLLKKMIKSLKESKNVQMQIDIFHDYLKTFKEVNESKEPLPIPSTISEIILDLKETEEIYTVIMKFIENSNSQPEQTKSLLKLLSYLISIDTSVDSGAVLRDIFFKL